MPGDLLEAQEFAQSKAQAQKRGRTGIAFADVAGADATLRELREVVEVRCLFLPHAANLPLAFGQLAACWGLHYGPCDACSSVPVSCRGAGQSGTFGASCLLCSQLKLGSSFFMHAVTAGHSISQWAQSWHFPYPTLVQVPILSSFD